MSQTYKFRVESFNVSLTSEHHDLIRQAETKDSEAAKLRRKVIDLIREDRRVKAAKLIGSWASAPVIELKGSTAVCSFKVKYLDEETLAPKTETQKYKPPLYVDPKTANLLLSGKLLEDDQKRRLLIAMHPELAAVVRDEGAKDD